MDKIKNYLKRIYGLDALSFGCVLISVVFNTMVMILVALGRQVMNSWNILALLPLAITGFRCFSTNIEKRRVENDWFIRRIEPLISKEAKLERKNFKFFNCPSCKQKIRVPKGKGRIEITCPRCGDRFVKKT